MALTDTAIRTAKPQEKPYRLADGGGKWWRLKYRFDGKEKRISLGTYSDTSNDSFRFKQRKSRTLQTEKVESIGR